MARRRARRGPELRPPHGAAGGDAVARGRGRGAAPVRARARLQRPVRLRRGGPGRGGGIRAAALRARALRRRPPGRLWHDLEVLAALERDPGVDPAWAGLLLAELHAFTLDGDRARLARLLARRSGELHRVSAVGHAHLDTAWLWPLEETWRKLVRTTTSQLRLMEAYPEHRFAHSQAQHYAWLEERAPALFARVREAVARGQWLPVGAMWVEPDCNLPVRRVARAAAPVRPALLRGARSAAAARSCGCPTSSATPRSSRSSCGSAGIDALPHAEALLEPLHLAREPHVHLAGARRQRGAHPLPAGRHLQRGGDGPRGPRRRRPRTRTTRARATPCSCSATATAAAGRPRRCSSGCGGCATSRACRRPRCARRTSSSTISRRRRRTCARSSASSTSSTTAAPTRRRRRVKRGNRRGERALQDAETLDALPRRRGAKPELDRLWRVLLLNQFHDILPGSSITEVYERARADLAEVVAGAEARGGARARAGGRGPRGASAAPGAAAGGRAAGRAARAWPSCRRAAPAGWWRRRSG